MSNTCSELPRNIALFRAGVLDLAAGVDRLDFAGCRSAKAGALADRMAGLTVDLVDALCAEDAATVAAFDACIADTADQFRIATCNFRLDATLGVARLPRMNDSVIAVQIFDLPEDARAGLRHALLGYTSTSTALREPLFRTLSQIGLKDDEAPSTDGLIAKLDMIMILIELAKMFPKYTRRIFRAIVALARLDAVGAGDGDGGKGYGGGCPKGYGVPPGGDGYKPVPGGDDTPPPPPPPPPPPTPVCRGRFAIEDLTATGQNARIASEAALNKALTQAMNGCAKGCVLNIAAGPFYTIDLLPDNRTFQAEIDILFDCAPR